MVKFGTDGVRGEANKELSPEIAFKLGRYGGYVLAQHIEEDYPRVLVGRDTRISGRMLEYALVAGLLSTGVEVLRLGVISTPGVAYLTRQQNATAGIMISASHNPAADNGIKFFGADGFKLADEQEREIEDLINSEVDDLPRPSAEGVGKSGEYKESILKYSQYLKQTVSGDLSGLSVVLDAANGATSPIVNRLFADLEADFYVMGASPDGLNINKGVGSTHPEALAEKVLEKEADIGLAFDGDGDRVIAVDEKGNIVDGDKILYICGKYLNENGQLKNSTIVSTVMSNIGFYQALEEEGIESVQTPVGDRHVMHEMRENGYNLGGEQSGHIIFLDHSTSGDGLLAGIQLMKILKESKKTLSELAEEVTIYPQRLINVRVNDKEGVMSNPAVREVIEEVESEMGESARLLIRPSGTEPLFRVMAEAKTQEECDAYCGRIVDVIEKEFPLVETNNQ
ncbi:MAG: phosphoglucosamine mutase [Atopostipes suicloacalis]|nr:phosphoglucosamine mutase [Atopostipes suicloacalis]